MNDYFKKRIRETGKSLYQISHETGISYTVLSELKNDKKSINNISSETTYKLCLYFQCNMEDLLNPFPLLQNSQGTYMGIKYKWTNFRNSGLSLHIYDADNDIVLTEIELAIPRWYEYYLHGITEMLIENYIRKRKIMEELP